MGSGPTDEVPEMPARTNLADAVYGSVRLMIARQEVKPGERVNIAQLAKTLDVSATPVREALSRLESEGVVAREAWRGFVLPEALNADGWGQLFAMRLLLEPYATSLAARERGSSLIVDLQEALKRMTGCPSLPTRQEYRSYAQADRAFHFALARASGNQFLSTAIERLQTYPQMEALYFPYRGRLVPDAISEHKAVLAAIEKSDPKQAKLAMKRHIQRASRRLLVDYILSERSTPFSTTPEASHAKEGAPSKSQPSRPLI